MLCIGINRLLSYFSNHKQRMHEMKRAMFLVEVMLEKEIPDHADLIAGRIYGITGTKIVGDASVSPVTVWQIDPMDSTSQNLAKAIIEQKKAEEQLKKLAGLKPGELVFEQGKEVMTIYGEKL